MGAARDLNLAFVTTPTEFATTGDKGAVVQCEGGFRADVRLFFGTCTGSAALVSIQILASDDEGSNYYHIGQFPILTDHNSDLEIARPVNIPKPATAGKMVRVKLNVLIADGTVTLMPVNFAFLEPLVDVALPAGDLDRGEGTVELATAV